MKYLDDLSIPIKLWGLTVTLVAGIVTTSLVAEQRANSAWQEAMTQTRDFDARIADSIQWERLLDTNIQRVISTAISKDPVIGRNFDRKIADTIQQIGALQKQVSERATSEADRKQLDLIAVWRKTVLAAVAKSKEINNSATEAQAQAFVDDELIPSVTGYIKALEDFSRLQVQQRDEAQAITEAAQRTERRTELWLVGMTAALGFLVAAAVVRSIVMPLRSAVAISEAIADGDLTILIPVERRDELGKMLRAMALMAERLRATVNEVRAGVDAVGTASSQIAMGNINLSQRTEEQAGSLQQTAASMEQLTTTVQRNAEGAAEVSRIATAASDAAARGGNSMREVVATMVGIRTGANRVAEIATAIDGIAFQTNILALNAAVEAARAGEQGRGFAVVAGEVRTLAQRSAAAAKDIKGLIAVSVSDVASGAERVQQTAAEIDMIVEQVVSVNGMIQAISTASREQARGVSEVSVAISQLDTMTQQNAALVEESTAATESMAEMSKRLASAMSAFRL